METLPPPIAGEPTLKPVPRSDRDAAAAGGPAGPIVPAAHVAVLDFLDPERLAVDIPLDHPFRLGGSEIRSVHVRRPLTAEVGEWNTRVQAGTADTYDLYAIMTGLPAPVLRGMVADDGALVNKAAFDFLPRWLRTASESPANPGSGDATQRL
ncbi:hypothetical protein C3941_09500 [Kaistia algarum]|uniref:phage tail assembly protein n=1 Tax=Kaistia algarum TaxID=2083279 RepID=UPI000CE7701F|nr:phage tail assembly protein [Kaistia algarum]MCX5512293.1 phage tail assembly protein [Kaistia algarum]PPE80384.1 hypothetical protein C3941_09500 [Kaistia algarum]